LAQTTAEHKVLLHNAIFASKPYVHGYKRAKTYVSDFDYKKTYGFQTKLEIPDTLNKLVQDVSIPKELVSDMAAKQSGTEWNQMN
jgi:hypothetical protein